MEPITIDKADYEALIVEFREARRRLGRVDVYNFSGDSLMYETIAALVSMKAIILDVNVHWSSGNATITFLHADLDKVTEGSEIPAYTINTFDDYARDQIKLSLTKNSCCC